MDTQKVIQQALEAKKEKILDLSDAIWGFAETGFQEEQSAAYYCQLLETEGFEVEQGIAGMPTAFRASTGSGKPVIGLLAEYDALPGLSQQPGITTHAPVCQGGAGHGCGHNGLGAGVLAAALAVKEYLGQEHTSGTVILFGCPSEEKGNGKTIMAREGCFDALDAAFTWHPMDLNAVLGMHSLANVSVYFDFRGKTAHAAACPHLGRSALDAAELMNVGVNYLREHIIPEARIHYAYLDVGGIAPNVVQETSRLHYFIRAPKSSQVQEILARVQDIAKGAALMTGTEGSMAFYAGVSDFIPNPTMSRVLQNALEAAGAPKFDEKDFQLASDFFENAYPSTVVDQNKQALRQKYGPRAEEKIARPLDTDVQPLQLSDAVLPGSTDVGDVSYVVPTAQFQLASYALCTPGHTWQLAAQMHTSIAHKAVLAAGEAIALATVQVMENPELCQQAREELNRETNGTYICPIPKEIGPQLNG